MITLDVLIQLNNRPPVRRDNFNRDSSFCQSGQGFVIHSGIHRSTAFIDKDTCADSWHAFAYWSRQGQKAVNAFIEAIIDGASLETAEENAFRKTRPRWSIVKPAGKGSQGNAQLLATRTRSGLETRVGAYTWRHLHARTK